MPQRTEAVQATPGPFVVLAVFEPDPGHFAQQLASIAAQSLAPSRLVLVIADCRSETLARGSAAAAGLTAEIVVPDLPLDVVRAFELGLGRALDLTETTPEVLIALSDQDDVWHADRLAEGAARLAQDGTDMVHSDARLIDEAGTLLRGSMFALERREPRPGLGGLLYRNNVTGMTVLMRRRLAALALPFPAQSGVYYYHDLWLALLAEATGGTSRIDRPLVDYRQHGRNSIGVIDRRTGIMGRIWNQVRKTRIDKEWIRTEAGPFALARYLASVLDDRIRVGLQDGRLLPGDVRHRRMRRLRPYLGNWGGLGRHWLSTAGYLLRLRPDLARIAFGHAVMSLARVVWILRQALGPGLAKVRQGFDETLFTLAPGAMPPALAATGTAAPRDYREVLDPRMSLRVPVRLDAEAPAFVVLVPSLNPSEIYAGIATAIDIGLGMAARGHRVRFVATDLALMSAEVSLRFLQGRMPVSDRAGTTQRISLHCAVHGERGTGALSLNRGDSLMATAWWTAHIARDLIAEQSLLRGDFLYLIQDFEPNFYPWGCDYSGARDSYDFAFRPIFNTTLLRDYFVDLGFDFARGAPAFRPSIDLARYAAAPRPVRGEGKRRLVLYGRPEVARNMFQTSVDAISRFIETKGLGPEDLDVVSIGQRHGPVTLPNGIVMTGLGKLPWNDYPEFLLGCDIGLSLMYSPHPSHPPLEMAASGVRVVTNRFGPKDLSSLSPAILAAGTDARDLAAALGEAWTAPPVTAAERRIALDPLGMPIEEMIERLAEEVAAVQPARAVAT